MSETIAAISTAPGEGGIGIVRVSGPASLDVMKQVIDIFPSNLKYRHAYLGNVMDCNHQVIDNAVFLLYKSPASYTGEDMLEIQAHGSNVSLKSILRTILNLNIDGIRLAEPGEFTKLAFLNGKMDLSQAEAVIDIIKAKSNLSLEIAQNQREGNLSQFVKNIREDILNVLAEMAVNIDYPDEDIEETNYNSLIEKLRWSLNDVDDLIDSFSIGKIAREGIKVAIVGKPNVGKSSLMNALLGEGRVIVTDIPGTTRDTVEESLSIDGVPIVLVDTAGLRDTDDKVEKIGIEKTEKAINNADMVMLVVDGSSSLDQYDEKIIDYISKINGDKVLVVINKNDIASVITEDMINKKLKGSRVISTSLLEENTIDSAKLISKEILKMFELGSINLSESNIINNERHLKMLKNASMNLSEAIEMIKNYEPIEVSELSVHYAYESLGKIIGEEVGEDIINAVFSKFCLGK